MNTAVQATRPVHVPTLLPTGLDDNPLIEEYTHPIPRFGRAICARTNLTPGIRLIWNDAPIFTANTGLTEIQFRNFTTFWTDRFAEVTSQRGLIWDAVRALAPDRLQAFRTLTFGQGRAPRRAPQKRNGMSAV